MKITINIGKRTAKHIAFPHTFYDGCGETEIVMKKVQKEIDKVLSKTRPKGRPLKRKNIIAVKCNFGIKRC